ncbi:alpha-L-fucosidase [Ferruginibacter paludis]|uniref:alpha-L-fucosidase n=1 Tax=Ferruginibacter paludis TaxID=1310417 RepID=UPI0025B49199|nr:alpha-L-fucosidase [Ferruginibacter paludis]MDN3656625.1 alpha-L-fucosidase [Ferruginibacter paludis]
MVKKIIALFICIVLYGATVSAQVTTALPEQNPKTKWFQEARFGMFIHWGLFAGHAGTYKGKKYYGISEWLQHRAKIPAKEYEQFAANFNPVDFDAEQWVSFAKASGIKYIVITAKHHEGFAMFKSMVSAFNIVDATPYKKDPMKALATACKKAGIKLGFYYSQFQDWHEPNGGGNNWDFDETKKDYPVYYAAKAIPQIKELLTNYGDLGLIWFDTPGDMTPEQSAEFLKKVKGWQPNCLVSSRVGNGLGDYTDFGDGEVPAGVVKGPWEAIFTHNDSWGYSSFDNNFKTPKEIIRLLTTIASKGGNLLLNIGPMANGKIPDASQKYFLATGEWLNKNGESIYGTTSSLIKPQPWGVTTNKPGKLFIHIFQSPLNGKISVPLKGITIRKVYWLSNKKQVAAAMTATGLELRLPAALPDLRDAVVAVEYSGTMTENYDTPETWSMQYSEFSLLPDFATVKGNATISPVTYSHYFGDWKHAVCIKNLQLPTDEVSFNIQVKEKGDYKITLEYAAGKDSEGEEGILEIGGQQFPFQVLKTGEHDEWKPLTWIRQTITILSVTKPGSYTLKMMPAKAGKELFNLKRIIAEPVE